jgi:alpha-galactosidase
MRRQSNAFTRMLRTGHALALFCLLSACQKSAPPAAQADHATPTVSRIEATARPDGSVLIKVPSAEFELSPRGYLQAFLVRDGRRFILDEPAPNAAGTTAWVNGRPVSDFVLEAGSVVISASTGKLGALGKRIQTTARSASSGLEESLAVEVYDDFPGFAVLTASLQNKSGKALRLDRVEVQQHRINAALADANAAPHQLWSFQGASFDWGRDEILLLPARFSRPNLMAAVVNQGQGGGVPVNAFWTSSVGEAIGHIETVPVVLSLPVNVAADQRVETGVVLEPKTTLEPGESFATPRTFLAVYHGDFYEPLRSWSRALQKEGWTLAKPSNEAYGIAWCGWGYEFNVTPAQMLGTVPKLKELGIKWATLDDRWFNTYGDWEPRTETFPGDSMKKMVDDLHQQGMKAQLWWYPLTAEDGHGKWESHKYVVSKVVRDHPDWLVLNKDGKPARVFRSLAVLCPAVPEVQQYYKNLTEKFIRDWGFDGHKLDNIYTAPACYNPKHHHKSPEDSIRAVADVYKVIYQTTRALKPDSVTQICPCGTTPNVAWLPFMDQAVTADPVGGVQVRRRIKWYKAILGPTAAIYGDHVELSEMTKDKTGQWVEHGQDFSSTLGTGGVLGTKFTWPESGPKFAKVALTPQKEEHWKKWTALYNSKMLSKGEFKNLYIYGYDVPEAYAIEKDGRMYYAFYAASPETSWKGRIELRGLQPGKYRVHDYVNDHDLGEVDASGAQLETEFKGSLLLETVRE